MSIARLALAGALVLTASPALAHEGWGIVVTRDGAIWVADVPANTIWRLRDGRLEAVARGVHSHALVAGPRNSVFGTHVDARRGTRGVWRIHHTGTRTEILPPSAELAVGLQSFLIARDGTIHSASAHQAVVSPGDTRRLSLLRRAPDGTVVRVAGGGAAGHLDGVGAAARFEGIDGMAWARNEDILLADGAYVRRVSRDGRVVTLGGRPVTAARAGEDLLGLALAPSGEVLVADFGQARVLAVTPSGAATPRYPAPWPWSPTGVAIAGDSLYVLEHLRAPYGILADLGIGKYLRVRRVVGDRPAATLAEVWGWNTRRVAIAFGALITTLVALVWYRRRRRRRAEVED